MNFPADLLTFLQKSRSAKWAILTGAGVSQESGLRTFRDAQVGLWTQYKPEDLASPAAFRRDPKLVWDWYAWRREAVKAVRPNPDTVQSRFVLRMLYGAANRLEEAAATFRDVLQRDPSHTNARDMLMRTEAIRKGK